jgi:hypothetical protein
MGKKMGKPEGRRPLRRSRSGWEDSIKMEFGLGWYGLD